MQIDVEEEDFHQLFNDRPRNIIARACFIKALVNRNAIALIVIIVAAGVLGWCRLRGDRRRDGDELAFVIAHECGQRALFVIDYDAQQRIRTGFGLIGLREEFEFLAITDDAVFDFRGDGGNRMAGVNRRNPIGL